MAEHAIKQGEHQIEKKSGTQGSRIIRQIHQWGILALLLFTCIMAAYRKFGG